jgi:LmbE family N-acetylglucosaminyl deacetylase
MWLVAIIAQFSFRPQSVLAPNTHNRQQEHHHCHSK